MNPQNGKQRERWSAKLGIVLAVAGSAVGLGNFLRFPSQAVQNGAGAFMIPYFTAFLLVGIPLAMIEWALGRHGGQFYHGSAPGVFDNVVKRPYAKYLGILGLLGPLIIFFYYCYIESWTLSYAIMALTGKYQGITQPEEMTKFLRGFQGIEKNEYFSNIKFSYIIFIFTFIINFAVIYQGIVKGIEKFCKFALALLFIIAAILAIRVITLPPVDGRTIWDGLGFMWNPDFSVLKSPKVWLAATGQIFFTLSVGIGVILTYSSYLKKNDDVALPSVTASSINEFAEVILGGSICIPAAFIFFSAAGAMDVAKSGSFNIGFVTMPMIFNHLGMGSFFGFLWFMLLFLAGITSSISLIQPAISFLEDEFDFSRRK